MYLPRIIAAIALASTVGLSAQSGSGPWTTPTMAEVNAIYPDLEALYVDLHKNPEIAFQETRTAATLAARLEELGFEVTTGIGKTGIVGILKNGPGPTAMMRTELDALPVEEKTGLPFASTAVTKNAAGQTVPVMHACGHDLHMAAWLGTARLMAENRNRWRGTLMMVGQPAEEGSQGAAAMLRDGLFTRFPKPDFALSLHDDDTMPSGTIGYHPGYFRSMSDTVTITVYGRGGHAAMPHNTIDPVAIAAQLVMALQTVVSRNVDPMRPAVLSVTTMRAGDAFNVISRTAEISGTARALHPEVQDLLEARIATIAEGLCATFGARATVSYQRGYPVTVNAPAETELAARVAREIAGDSAVDADAAPVMGGEDFSFMLNARPGAFIFLGNGATSELHTDTYDFNDDIIPVGVSYWVRLAETALATT